MLLHNLLSEGISVIPIGADKRPFNRLSWDRYKYTLATKDEIESWSKETDTFAIIHGKFSKTFAFDFEDRGTYYEFFSGFEYMLKSAMVVSTAHGGFQVVFRSGNPPRRKIRPYRKNGKPVLLDILGEVGYGIVTGHIDHSMCDPKHQNCPHKGIGKYIAEGFPREFPPITEKDIDSWINSRAIQLGWELSSFGTDPEVVLQGERHNAVLSYCSSLVKNRATKEELLVKVHKFNNNKCKPPLPEKEVRDIIEWFAERNSWMKLDKLPDQREEFEGRQLRLAQIEIIKKARESGADTFAIELPTGGGKTMIYLSLTHGKPSIIVLPDRAMQDQLLKQYGVPTVKGMANYICPETKDAVSDSPCPILNECSNSCPYKVALENGKKEIEQGKQVAVNFANYRPFLSLPPFKDGRGYVVFDEAHQLAIELSPMKEVPYQDLEENLDHLAQEKNISELQLEDLRNGIINKKAKGGDTKALVRQYRKLQGDLQETMMILDFFDGAYVVHENNKNYIRLEEESILRGLTSSGVHHKILVSATLPFDLGIPIIRSDHSVVTKANAPIIIASIQRLNAKTESENPEIYDGLASFISLFFHLYLDKGRTKKAIIHSVSTKRAETIGKLLRDKGHEVIIHKKGELSKAIADFKSKNYEFLIVASANSGLDFYGDDFGLQFILKVPYPDMSDPQWNARKERFGAEKAQGDYSKATAIALEQACGRIARGPDDIGVTVILDASFKNLYDKYKDLFSKQFQERLVFL